MDQPTVMYPELRAFAVAKGRGFIKNFCKTVGLRTSLFSEIVRGRLHFDEETIKRIEKRFKCKRSEFLPPNYPVGGQE